MSKIRIEDIREEIQQDGWKLLSTEYKNLDSELIFKCNNDHTVYSSWKKIRNKRLCPICQEAIQVQTNTKIPRKDKKIKRCLALDQATYISGYAIFDGETLRNAGTFETSKEEEIDRFYEIRMWLINMIQNWQPDIIFLEGIQYQQNIGVTTFETLARLQGILMMVCKENNIEFHICHTATWRSHSDVKGRTRDDKKKSANLIVKKLYNCNFPIDTAEAILIGRYGVATFGKQVKVSNWE